jgi:hypothetical protein
MDFEARTIRETELDRSGVYREASLQFHPTVNLMTPDPDITSVGVEGLVRVENVFVDTMGRVILPADHMYDRLESITFLDEGNGESPRPCMVERVEPRYLNQKASALVVYLRGEQ